MTKSVSHPNCQDCFRESCWINLENNLGYCEYHIKFGVRKQTYKQKAEWDRFNKREEMIDKENQIRTRMEDY